MAYQALYRKWRPRTFDDVIGQPYVVSTLKNEILSGKTAHAYLFCGTRGTGKTSCAKIFARAINCLHPKDGNPCNECEICRGALDGSIMDITEIDAASNNGVDNIREIRDEVSYSAAQAKYKIYIIDEVHMLSGGAFNALLKTLEEPPPYVVFILATTEAHKLPATITSRCQRFDFKRISVHDIVIRLREITTAEGVSADIEALELVARLADGAMRDALSILDQCISALTDKITVEGVNAVMGVAPDEAVAKMVSAIADKDNAALLSALSDVVRDGKDVSQFIDTLIRRFRDILVCKVTSDADGLFEYAAEVIDEIQRAAKRFSAQELSYIVESLCAASADAKWQKNAKVLYELALLRLCDDTLAASNAALLARLEKLEQLIANGMPLQGTSAPPVPEAPVSAPTDSDAPPWDVEPMPAPKPVQPAPKQPPEPVSQCAAAKPAVSPVRKPAAGNVWAELLGILQKKYPPLYGALFMKKAKYADSTLYLINETYVKEIINLYSGNFNDALWSVCGGEAKTAFVTEAEFDSIEETVDTRVRTLVDRAAKTVKTAAAPAETSTPATAEAVDADDPLDALLTLDNDDIIIEDE